jgi:hypothetical protein
MTNQADRRPSAVRFCLDPQMATPPCADLPSVMGAIPVPKEAIELKGFIARQNPETSGLLNVQKK